MLGGSCAAMTDDKPERALAGSKILKRWSSTGYDIEHLIETHNLVAIALYAAQPAPAPDLMEQRWGAI
jgi:hypothetical protein